jgi:predicted choloylglycine hydrolase
MNRNATETLTFHAVDEDAPGAAWASLFARFGASYLRWFAGGRDDDGPSRAESEAELLRHMPELAPSYERLLWLAGDSDEVARLLCLWRPPAYPVACSLACIAGAGGPALVRNYEYDPQLFEGVLLRTCWGGRRVLAMSDCLWGALDGVNDAGLAVALAFGGRPAVGAGFGVPLIVRYVLETCATVGEAVAALSRIPSHMAYNLMLVDTTGVTRLVETSPDRPIVVRDAACATNHQSDGVDTPFGRATASRVRMRYLKAAVSEAESPRGVIGAFHRPPVYSTAWAKGWGTLYTAVYEPRRASVELSWPGQASWAQSIGGFEGGSREVHLRAQAIEEPA